MASMAPPETPASPFSPRAVLALVAFGAIVFIAMLWMIGAGMTGGDSNDGGGHVGGKGLNGYAAMAAYLERRDFVVRRARTKAVFEEPALLVLTPPHDVDPKELDRIVAKRHLVGPTIVVTPKWEALQLPPIATKGKRGWVTLAGVGRLDWPGFRDDIGLSVKRGDPRWTDGAGNAGILPSPGTMQSGHGVRLVPLAMAGGRILAGYIDDGGIYPGLEGMAMSGGAGTGENEDIFPLVLVFEPDLLDNYGMANEANAHFAEALVRAAAGDAGAQVNFDLTLNGYARSANLLTLAFTPPFLAATLCLLLAALVAGWRAFLRFGPPRTPQRAIAFGKRALVANTAGLIRRARRLHLLGEPYATAARERLIHALALPREADAATDARIDRALERRGQAANAFSAAALRLSRARRTNDILKAAHDLHALERMLSR